MELYGIISIIDDEHFGGENAFRAQYAGSGASSAALDVLRDRLKPICHRSLRRQVQEAGHISFTKRNAKTFHFDPSQPERDLYEQLSTFLKRTDTVSYGDRANQLVVLQVRKILGSSSFAVAKYLETLIERLQRRKAASLNMTDDIEDFGTTVEEADQDVDENDDVHITPEMIEAEILNCRAILRLPNPFPKTPKARNCSSACRRLWTKSMRKVARARR
jgi:hypothetical protein